MDSRQPRLGQVARALACAFLAFSSEAFAEKSIHWPQFRGPRASGLAHECQPPSHWNGPKGEGIAWRTAIPGLGLSSPVIWGDRVFVTTAVSAGVRPDLKIGLYGDIESQAEEAQQEHRWILLCLEKKSGRILWEKVAAKGLPQFKRHPKSSQANSTPATDGQSVVACFGSEGLFCYDFDGNLRWHRALGSLDSGYYKVPDAQWGFGASPVIHEGKIIMQCDVQKGSFLATYDLTDGHEIWRVPREDVPSWSTPTVLISQGKTQIILNGHRHMGGYDFATGKEIWRLGGGGDIPVPTPVIDGDVIF